MARLTMSGRGTLALPRAVREAMGAAPGDRYDCVVLPEGLLLVRVPRRAGGRRMDASAQAATAGAPAAPLAAGVPVPTPAALPAAPAPLPTQAGAPAGLAPAAAAAIAPAAVSAPQAGNGALRSALDAPGYEVLPTVMVVDDSATVRKVAQRLLEREGYQVVLASDGVDALKQLQAITPHLMLVDIEMPRMDGFEFARVVRASHRLRQVPIIIISSYVDEAHRATAREIGVDEYLGKPYEASELLAHVRSLLARAMRAHAHGAAAR